MPVRSHVFKARGAGEAGISGGGEIKRGGGRGEASRRIGGRDGGAIAVFLSFAPLEDEESQIIAVIRDC